MISINENLSIPEASLSEEFIRASGPGGQNVNKVATAVQLRFSLKKSRLPESVLQRLRALAGSRLTLSDDVIVQARSHRTQEMNRQAALKRLLDLLLKASIAPKVRKKTKISKGARAGRRKGKIERSQTKSSRSWRPDEV